MDRRTFLGWQVLSVLALALLVATGASANSNTVSYQGVLRDAAQAPVADDSYDMRFSIWDDATAGAKRWGDENQSVTTRNGLFSVNLGSVVSLGTVFANYAALWLQIEVDLDGGAGLEVYNPRVPLASVPYAQKALNAQDADTVDGQHAAAFAAASHAHDGAAITSGTVSADRFSAYPDLVAESKIGTGVAQVAAGNHTHNTLSGPSGSPSDVVVVNAAGNVGIGKTPTTKLDVDGGITSPLWKVHTPIPFAACTSGNPRTGSFVSSGGTLLIFASGSLGTAGFSSNQNNISLSLDGTTIATSVIWCATTGGPHYTPAPIFIVRTGVGPGSHSVSLRSSTTWDSSDCSCVVVYELPF